MKRICRMAVVCILLCGLILPIPVHARESDVQMEQRMASISVYGTELYISSDGTASISGFVRGKLGVTSTYVEVTLQKSVSGTWIDSVGEGISSEVLFFCAFLGDVYEAGIYFGYHFHDDCYRGQ